MGLFSKPSESMRIQQEIYAEFALLCNVARLHFEAWNGMQKSKQFPIYKNSFSLPDREKYGVKRP